MGSENPRKRKDLFYELFEDEKDDHDYSLETREPSDQTVDQNDPYDKLFENEEDDHDYSFPRQGLGTSNRKKMAMTYNSNVLPSQVHPLPRDHRVIHSEAPTSRPTPRRSLFDLLYEAQNHTDTSAKMELWSQVKDRIEKHPKEAEARDDGSLPLHIALASDAPLNLIKALVHAYPKACKIHQFERTRFPLVLGIYWKKSWKTDEARRERDYVIRCVLTEAPEMGAEICEGNASVLHLLLELKPSLYIVRYLVYRVESLPGGLKKNLCQIKDGQGQLPLHVAIEYHCSDSVIQYVLEKYRKAVTVPRLENMTPLHLALLRGCSSTVLSLLLDKQGYKELWSKDEDGNSPLHLWFSKERIDDNFKRWEVREIIKKSMTDTSTAEHLLSDEQAFDLIIKTLGQKKANDLLHTKNEGGRNMLEAAKDIRPSIKYPQALFDRMEDLEDFLYKDAATDDDD